MNHLRWDLGLLAQGSVVEVVIDTQANVMLLDDSNYNAYQSGRRFTLYGGWYARSPARISAPRAGRWNAVVDLGGGAGRINASVNVLTPA